MNRRFRRFLCVGLSTLLLSGICLPGLAVGEDAAPGPVQIACTDMLVREYSEAEFASLIEALEGDTLTFSGDDTVMGLYLTFDPAWMPEGIGVVLTMPTAALSIPYGMLAELAEQESGALAFSFHVPDDDKAEFFLYTGNSKVPFYTVKYPMTLSINTPSYAAAYPSDYMLWVKKEGKLREPLPRSFRRDGAVHGRIHEPGCYVFAQPDPHIFPFYPLVRGHWSEQAVNYLYNRRVLTNIMSKEYSQSHGEGFWSPTFRPDEPVTRIEFVAALMDLIYVEPQGGWDPNDFFYDSVDDDSLTWYSMLAKFYGVVVGSPNGSFRPNEPITRQDMFVVTRRAMGVVGLMPEMMTMQFVVFNDWDSVAGYAQNPIQDLARLGLANGSNGNIRPSDRATRGEAAQLLYNLLQFDAG